MEWVRSFRDWLRRKTETLTQQATRDANDAAQLLADPNGSSAAAEQIAARGDAAAWRTQHDAAEEARKEMREYRRAHGLPEFPEEQIEQELKEAWDRAQRARQRVRTARVRGAEFARWAKRVPWRIPAIAAAAAVGVFVGVSVYYSRHPWGGNKPLNMADAAARRVREDLLIAEMMRQLETEQGWRMALSAEESSQLASLADPDYHPPPPTPTQWIPPPLAALPVQVAVPGEAPVVRLFPEVVAAIPAPAQRLIIQAVEGLSTSSGQGPGSSRCQTCALEVKFGPGFGSFGWKR